MVAQLLQPFRSQICPLGKKHFLSLRAKQKQNKAKYFVRNGIIEKKNNKKIPWQREIEKF